MCVKDVCRIVKRDNTNARALYLRIWMSNGERVAHLRKDGELSMSAEVDEVCCRVDGELSGGESIVLDRM